MPYKLKTIKSEPILFESIRVDTTDNLEDVSYYHCWLFSNVKSQLHLYVEYHQYTGDYGWHPKPQLVLGFVSRH